MTFETLNDALGNKLVELGLSAYTENQKKIIKQYKQGQSAIVNNRVDDNIMSALCFISFIAAPQMFEGAPRVLWIVPKNEEIKKRKDVYQQYTMRGDTTIELADDKGKQIEQRNAIFQGTEVLLGNPKRLLDLYIQNGFHVNKIQLVIIENFDEICKDIPAFQAIRRIFESLPKCRKIIFSEKGHHRQNAFLEEQNERFMSLSLAENE